MMRLKNTLLLGLCLLLAFASVAETANLAGVGRISRTRGIKIGPPGIQFIANEDAPTTSERGQDLANGRIYYDTTSGFLGYHGSSWVALSAAGVTADTLYDNGAWTVAVDGTGATTDIEFISTVLTNNFAWVANLTGTHPIGIAIEARHATASITDALLIYYSGASSGVITDAVDVSDAEIVNAINVGDNVILGAAGSIALTDFTVGADGNTAILTDTAGATAMLALTHSATSGTQNDGITVSIGTSGTMTDGIDVSDGEITNAINVGDNVIKGGACAIDTTYFDVDATGAMTDVGAITSDGTLICAALQPTGAAQFDSSLDVDGTLNVDGASTLVGDVGITGDLTVTGAANIEIGTWNTDAVTAVTGGGSLTLNGDGTGGVSIGATSTGDVAVGDNLTVSGNVTVTLDAIVNGGDFTMTSATASKPNLLFTNSVVGTTGSVTTYDHTRGGIASVDADDIHTDIYRGYDDNATPLSDIFVTVLYEVTDSADGAIDGNVTWKVASASNDWNFLELDGVDGVEFNAGSEEINVTMDGDEATSLFVLDAATNDITLTRALAAAATTDGPVLVVSNTSATGDVGVFSVSNAAASSATAATVVLTSSATAFDQSTLTIAHACTAGTSTVPAVLIDSEQTTAAALEVRSPSTAGGTDAQLDDTVVAIVGEGVGGALYVSRAIGSATEPIVTIEEESATTTGPALLVKYAGNATADDVAVTLQATDAAYDEAVVAIVNAGVGGGLFVDQNISTGATLEPALLVDSENVDNAGLVVYSACDGTGSDGDADQYAAAIIAEGVGGGLHVHRDVSNPTHPLVMIEEDNAMAASSHYLLHVQSDADASASLPTVYINTTDSNNDQPLAVLHQLGAAANLYLSGLTPLLQIGDTGTEDSQIDFVGNAQTFHIGLDDTADDLVIGKGTALGTTQAIGINDDLTVTVAVGLILPVQTITTTESVEIIEGSKTFFLNAAGGFVTTLPTAASSAGVYLKFVIIAAPAGGDYTIVTDSSNNVMVGGFNELEVDTTNDGPYQAAGDLITFHDGLAVIGDYVEMISDGAKWYVTGQVQADGGVSMGST